MRAQKLTTACAAIAMALMVGTGDARAAEMGADHGTRLPQVTEASRSIPARQPFERWTPTKWQAKISESWNVYGARQLMEQFYGPRILQILEKADASWTTNEAMKMFEDSPISDDGISKFASETIEGKTVYYWVKMAANDYGRIDFDVQVFDDERRICGMLASLSPEGLPPALLERLANPSD